MFNRFMIWLFRKDNLITSVDDVRFGVKDWKQWILIGKKEGEANEK